MIKNLDEVLAVGKPWPPVSEIDRLKRYEQNECLFDGDHSKVFNVLLNLFSSHTAEYNKLIIVLNWHKRLSTLWADFLYGEQPTATANEDPESEEQQYLKDFIDRNQYWVLQHTRALDVSRFGHGIIEGYYEDGCKLQVVHPAKYFPIGDAFGRVQEHMIAWLDEPQTDDHVKQSKLFIRIHRPGEIESREYVVSSMGNIIAGPRNEIITETGVKEPLVSVVENLKTSSGKLVDDYGDLDSIIKRMESRLTRVGRILDVHSEPMMYADEDSGVFTKTETGASVYDSKKKVFALPKGSEKPGYTTWDGQLTAAFTEFETDLKQMYAISETCEACFEPTKLGAQVSGTALRLMLFVPLKKVDRLKLNADPAIRRELETFTAFEAARGYPDAMPLESIAVHWEDGLPEDFKETVANICALKVQGLIWEEMALKMLFHLEGKALQDAIQKLRMDQTMNPVVPGFGGDYNIPISEKAASTATEGGKGSTSTSTNTQSQKA